ncbi:hypothetical protein [Sphaerospermopsis reniformis]|nr:hypothetical protein [Sphaerospermopsis reniformis]
MGNGLLIFPVPSPQSPVPSPQSPVPSPQSPVFKNVWHLNNTILCVSTG